MRDSKHVPLGSKAIVVLRGTRPTVEHMLVANNVLKLM